MKQLIIKGPKVYAEDKILNNADILIEESIIKKIGKINSNQNTEKINILEFPNNYHLVPGFIDMHIHGAAGADVMDATDDALETISSELLKEGVTSFLPTVMTGDLNKINHAIKNIANYKNNKGAQILGINLEGPFLSKEKNGAQPIEQLLTPNIELIKKWQKLSNNLIKIVTIAPELPNALEAIKYLQENNIIAALGHSNADYEAAKIAIKLGSKYATHLFNCMPPIHHRKPGLISALLLDNNVTTEIIADGIHLHPAIIELIVKLKGFDNTILVSDAMRAKNLADGNYTLSEQKVIVKNNEARLQNNALAGSTLRLDTAIRNIINYTNCSLFDVLKMVTANPAKKLNIFDRKGSIAIGKDADLVVLDESLQVKLTLRGTASPRYIWPQHYV
ncbi:MAG: N-acetylglucosamine-6-phosphate deacetylase [Gammaproteobacteria bacterium]|nr:N-acetylglucosamine-6-phosphate deacetylase [Gammaproteobacteria bacterium]